MQHPVSIRLLNGANVQPAERLSDDDLMLLSKANRQDAYELLVRRHQRLVLGLAVRFLSDKVLGRDVAQDVFLSIWKDRHRYQPRGRFRSYLVSVTLHRCHNVARGRRRAEKKVSSISDSDTDPSMQEDLPLHRLVEAERCKQVRSKLVDLPEKMRQVLILRYTHELPIAEIAELTRLPMGTVKSHLNRGLKYLHQMLTGEGK